MSLKRNEQLNKEKLIKSMTKHYGNVTNACADAGLSRQTFYIYYNSDDQFKKEIDELEHHTLDFVENQLFKLIEEGSEKSIHFYLKYRGKKRGYNDSLDITSAGEKINEIKLVKVNKKGEDKS